jgi:hypothetical protein
MIDKENLKDETNLLSGFDVNWFLAASPMSRSPSEVNAT